MKDYNNKGVCFNSLWFARWQPVLLFMLNNPSFRIREWTRDQFGIYDNPKLRVDKITPEAYILKLDNNLKALHGYTFGKHRNRMINLDFGHKLFELMHRFDIRVANRFLPALNLGFDTLPAYSSTADGLVVSSGYDTNWTTCRNLTSGSKDSNNTRDSQNYVHAWHDGTYYSICRAFFYFDTSAMGSGQTISSATMRIVTYFNYDSDGSVQEGTQSTPFLANGDFDAFTGSSFGNNSWAPSGNDTEFTLDGSGETFVNNNSAAKLCIREYSHDYLDSAPSSYYYFNGGYWADNSGITNDPKLTIEFSAGGGGEIQDTAIIHSMIF